MAKKKTVKFQQQVNEDGEKDMRAEITTEEDTGDDSDMQEDELEVDDNQDAGDLEEEEAEVIPPLPAAVKPIKADAPLAIPSPAARSASIEKVKKIALEHLAKIGPVITGTEEDRAHRDLKMNRIHFQMLKEMLENQRTKPKKFGLSEGNCEMIAQNYELLRKKGRV